MKNQKINILVAGSTGYIGIQLIKLLCKHKHAKIKYLCGNSSVGKKIELYDKSLKKYRLPKISKINYNFFKDVDVIFTALPDGESQKISNHLYKNNLLIDLSADFRIKDYKIYEKNYKIKHLAKKNLKKSIYGLPEIKKEIIKKTNIIACPGCYPTSIILPLFPLLKFKLINYKNIIIDSKSGFSGAGRGIFKKIKKENLNESLSAYGIGNHRHNAEIKQEFDLISKKIDFEFIPHLSPMFKGILTTIYLKPSKNNSVDKIIKFLKKYYSKNKFIRISHKNKFLSTNNVINTNLCEISVCSAKEKDKIIILSTIDNLIKGGAGQAIQNFNTYYNFNKNEGFI